MGCWGVMGVLGAAEARTSALHSPAIKGPHSLAYANRKRSYSRAYLGDAIFRKMGKSYSGTFVLFFPKTCTQKHKVETMPNVWFLEDRQKKNNN